MGRVNRNTNGVFTDIVGGQDQIPKYDQFINVQDSLDNPPSKKLVGYLKKYKSKLDKNKLVLGDLAKLEDVIMQLRTHENLTSDDIKLNVVREYIYARIPCHRKDTEAKDIRVIVGQTSGWGTNIDNLLGNIEFMKLAKEKILSTIKTLIDESSNLIKTTK